MQFFSIHTRPGQSPAGGGYSVSPDAVATVPSGFSWAAALLTPIWLIWHRQWWGLAGYLGLMVVLGLIYAVLDIADPADWLIGIAMAFLFGASAADLRRWTLGRNGWRLTAIVAARDALEAELLFARQAQILAAPKPDTPRRAPVSPQALSGGEISALPRLV